MTGTTLPAGLCLRMTSPGPPFGADFCCTPAMWLKFGVMPADQAVMWLKMSLIRPDRATSFHSVMLPVLTDAPDRRRSSGARVSPPGWRGMPIRMPTPCC
jgi:hypothetical protein